MEDGVVVVAVETVLQEVAGGQGCLLREELKGDVTGGGAEDAGGSGLGLEVVEGRHFEVNVCGKGQRLSGEIQIGLGLSVGLERGRLEKHEAFIEILAGVSWISPPLQGRGRGAS